MHASSAGDSALQAATPSSSSTAPAPMADGVPADEEVTHETQDGAEGNSGKLVSRLPIELDTVKVDDRLGIAGSLPAMAVRAVSGLVGLAGLGIGYGMAKFWTAQDWSGDCSMANSTSFRMGCEAFLYANGIFPSVLCEHEQGYQVGPLPEDEDQQEELFRSTPIIVANHVSYLDAMILPHICKMPRLMSKSEVKNWPFFGCVGEDLDSIWVDRSSPETRMKALEAVADHVASWRDGDRPLLIFPEGTTSNGRGLCEFRKGAFTSGAPVRPVVIKYTGSWNPASVNFREAELDDEPLKQSKKKKEKKRRSASEGRLSADSTKRSSISGRYIPYGDGDWAVQFAGHLVHSCTALVCRIYYPSEQEQADPMLYAANVRQYMLERLQELHVACSGAKSSSNLDVDERILALRRRTRMRELLLRGTQERIGSEAAPSRQISSTSDEAALPDAKAAIRPERERLRNRAKARRARQLGCLAHSISEPSLKRLQM